MWNKKTRRNKNKDAKILQQQQNKQKAEKLKYR